MNPRWRFILCYIFCGVASVTAFRRVFLPALLSYFSRPISRRTSSPSAASSAASGKVVHFKPDNVHSCGSSSKRRGGKAEPEIGIRKLRCVPCSPPCIGRTPERIVDIGGGKQRSGLRGREA